MSTNRKTALGIALGVLFLIAAGVAGFLRVVSKRPDAVPADVVPPSWAEFRTSPGHQQHIGKATIVCKDCHGYDTAGFTNPGTGVCSHCHEKETAHTHTGGKTGTDCLSCHAFGTSAAPTCIGCHAEARGTHAAIAQHATVDCKECHHPHDTPSLAPKDCTSCHDQRALAHANHPESKNCQDCHRAHEPARAARRECASCHATPAGPKPASHDSCLSCHKPHDFVAGAPRVCMGCHGVKPTLVATTVEAHARCTSCHTPHSPSQAASSCQGCHTQVHVAHGAKGSCIGCHQPHQGDVDAKASTCTTCHSSVATEDHGGAHARGTSCTDCHQPHTFAPLPRGQLCVRCHARETTLTSANAGHRECNGCHGPATHRPEKAPACGSCHKVELASAPAGHQKCGNCHESHGGEIVAAAIACTNCHAKKATVLHGSLAGGCTSCHRPHGPKGIPAPPPCSTCHESAKLPALHAVGAHADCGRCHSSHAPPRSDRKTCTGTCHTNRRDHQPTAPVCTGCHVFRT